MLSTVVGVSTAVAVVLVILILVFSAVVLTVVIVICVRRRKKNKLQPSNGDQYNYPTMIIILYIGYPDTYGVSIFMGGFVLLRMVSLIPGVHISGFGFYCTYSNVVIEHY